MSQRFAGNDERGRRSGGLQSSSSSSTKRKKNLGGEDEEAKQATKKKPLRGLGVAQLERIRLHAEFQMARAYNPPSLISYNTNAMMQQQEQQEGSRVAASAGYSSMASSSPFARSTPPSSAISNYALRPNATTAMGFAERANKFNNIPPSQDTRCHSFPLPALTTRHLLHLQQEEWQPKKEHRSESIRSSSQNYGSSDDEGIDLELRL